MTIEINPTTGNKTFLADTGKAICQKDETGPTTITSACAPAETPNDAWKDCEYGEEDEKATESDKDAELAALGVDMTEG